MKSDDPRSTEDQDDNDKQAVEPPLGPPIALWARYTGGAVFVATLAALIGYPIYVIATSFWVEYDRLGIRVLILASIVAFVGYPGLTIARNKLWLTDEDRAEVRKASLMMFVIAFAIQVFPCLVFALAFLVESAGLASLGIVAFICTAVIGMFMIAMGVSAVVTGFPPSQESLDGLVRSVGRLPTNPADYSKK